MKIKYPTNTTLVLVLLFFFSAAQAQTVSYKVIENKPYKSVLSIGIVPLDLILVDGNPLVGPGVDVKFRPLNNIQVNASVANSLYSKSIDNKDSVSGLKNAGGLYFDAGAEFIWFRKGINYKDPNNENEPMKYKLPLKSTTSGDKMYTTNLLFPYNRAVERSIRGGIWMNNLAWDPENAKNDVSTITAPYVGISKRTFKSAEIDAEGYGVKKRSDTYGYYLDVAFGSVSYFNSNTSNTSDMGFRFGIEYQTIGGLMPVGVLLEMGKMPEVGGYIRAKYIFSLDYGRHYYEGEYKMRKKAKRAIPALIQALI